MRTLSTILTAALAMTTTAVAETWSLSVVNSHYMGANSGIANGAWPPGSEFNSTVDFVLQRIPGDDGANYTEVSCSADWKDPDYPTTWMACSDSETRWRFATQPGFTACNFTLEIIRADIANAADATEQNATGYIGFASVHISANNKTNPSSFLTCLGGEPLTGIHCSTDAINSVKLGFGGPIPLTPNFTYYQLEPFFLPEVQLITPSGDNSTSCNRTIQFNVTDTPGDSNLSTCSNSLPCNPWPFNTQPSLCTSPVDTYTWWWRLFQRQSPPTPPESQLYVQHTYCLITDFTTVEDLPIVVNAQATGFSLADVGSQLQDEGCGDTTCVTETPGDAGLTILITGFGVAADPGCILPHGN